MKSFAKRLFSVVLSFAVIMTLVSESFTVSASGSVPLADEIYTDNDVEIITEDTFYTVFSNKRSSADLKIDNITYSYAFTQLEDIPESAYVELNFTLFIAEQAYYVQANGIVNAYILTSGEILWEGPIEGTTIINGNEYVVVAGFSKLDSSPNVGIGITLQKSSILGSEDVSFVAFQFGEAVISQEIYQEISSVSTGSNITEALNAMSNNEQFGGGYDRIAIQTVSFKNSVFSGYAQSASCYFTKETNRIALGITSYTSTIDNYYRETGISTTSIASCSIGLRRNSYTSNNYSYIIGIESFKFDETNFDKALVLLKGLFNDILNTFKVPTGTIDAVFDNLKGTVSRDVFTDYAVVNLSFGLQNAPNFDDITQGVPIVFQLAKIDNGNYVGDSLYTCSTSLQYRTMYWSFNEDAATSFYTNAPDASYPVYVTLSGR